MLATEGLQRLLNGLRALGIGAEHFPWPPPDDPDRAPYRGWAPLEEADAAVFFGRDAQILRGLDVLRGMRTTRGGVAVRDPRPVRERASRRFCGPPENVKTRSSVAHRATNRGWPVWRDPPETILIPAQGSC